MPSLSILSHALVRVDEAMEAASTSAAAAVAACAFDLYHAAKAAGKGARAIVGLQVRGLRAAANDGEAEAIEALERLGLWPYPAGPDANRGLARISRNVERSWEALNLTLEREDKEKKPERNALEKIEAILKKAQAAGMTPAEARALAAGLEALAGGLRASIYAAEEADEAREAEKATFLASLR